MIEKLMKKFAMSRQGAVDFVKAVVICTLSDIVVMIPVGLLYMVTIRLLPAAAAGTGGIVKKAAQGPVFYATAVVGIFILLYTVNYFKYNAQYLSTYKESGVRRMSLAEKLRCLPLSFFGRKDLSDLTTTIMEDCAVLETDFSHMFPLFYSSVCSTVIIALSLFLYNVKLAFASLWVIPVSLAIVIFSKQVQLWSAGKQTAAKLACADGIQECLENVRDLKANNAESVYLSGLDEKIRMVEKKSVHNEYLVGVFVVLAQMVLKTGIATTAFTGGVLLVHGEITLPLFILFLIVVSRLYDPLSNSLIHLAGMIGAETNINRMHELDEQPVQTGMTDFHTENCSIVFDHVGFFYADGTEVLRDVSFTARQGEVTALVGPSGGGKSTVTRLAARFWDVRKGCVMLGDTPVRAVDPETLLKFFSIVFQDVTLFNNTVMENIRIGRYSATDSEVLEAAAAAQCDEFVRKLPQGYETIIGENGAVLSGGERQRLSIARAILKNAPVILLDEATASLDTENETKVQKALSRLIRGKTILIVAHRMRTVSGADHIIVLKDGIVTEDGTPEQLLKQGGEYARMVSLQRM